MNNHCPVYRNLISQSDTIQREADELLDQALFLRERNLITEDAWYQQHAVVTELRNQAYKKQLAAKVVEREYWLEKCDRHENEQYAKAAMLEEGLP